MDPSRIIDELCDRHGVSMEFGRRILPLVERAGRVRPELRKRILEMVERSFAEEARRQKDNSPMKNLEPDDRKILSTVAAVLHGWKPPFWLTPKKGGIEEGEEEK